jgi:hypothetical protein
MLMRVVFTGKCHFKITYLANSPLPSTSLQTRIDLSISRASTTALWLSLHVTGMIISRTLVCCRLSFGIGSSSFLQLFVPSRLFGSHLLSCLISPSWLLICSTIPCILTPTALPKGDGTGRAANAKLHFLIRLKLATRPQYMPAGCSLPPCLS